MKILVESARKSWNFARPAEDFGAIPLRNQLEQAKISENPWISIENDDFLGWVEHSGHM